MPEVREGAYDPWSTAVKPDGSFKSVDELRSIYLGGGGIEPSKETIAYCRIGERSCHARSSILDPRFRGE